VFIFVRLAIDRDIQGIQSTCKLVPELVGKNLEEIYQIIVQAIEKPFTVGYAHILVSFHDLLDCSSLGLP
jgi:hypothetical protein